MEVFEQRRAALAGLERVLVVVDAHALVRGQELAGAVLFVHRQIGGLRVRWPRRIRRLARGEIRIRRTTRRARRRAGRRKLARSLASGRPFEPGACRGRGGTSNSCACSCECDVAIRRRPVARTRTPRGTALARPPPRRKHMKSPKSAVAKQTKELLYQALETELGGVEVYRTAVLCARNEDLKEEWTKYLAQTERHVEIVRDSLRKARAGRRSHDAGTHDRAGQGQRARLPRCRRP